MAVDDGRVSSPQPDLAFSLAEALLGRVVTRMTALGRPPGRAFVYDGPAVPADDCCEGMVWVRVGTIQPTDGSADPYREMRNLPAGPSGATILFELGVLRCTVAPPVGEDGEPPTPDDFTEDARRAGNDRQSLRLAVMCDFPTDLIAAMCDGQIPGAWIPVDAGGCSGGWMTTTVGTSIVM